jgi:hypothetical protein
MKSPFEIHVRRGVAASKVLAFADPKGIAVDVSGTSMVLNIYTNDAAKTLVGSRNMLSNTGVVSEKSVTFLLSDVLVPGNFYLELDAGGTPPTDGAYGLLYVEGK